MRCIVQTFPDACHAVVVYLLSITKEVLHASSDQLRASRSGERKPPGAFTFYRQRSGVDWQRCTELERGPAWWTRSSRTACCRKSAGVLSRLTGVTRSSVSHVACGRQFLLRLTEPPDPSFAMNPQLDLSEMVTNDRRNYTKTGTSAFNLGVAPNGRRFQRFSVRHPGGWFRAPPISFTPRPKKMPRRDDSVEMPGG